MNQTQQILNHLMNNTAITSLEALQLYGCFRLSARIWELRKQGYQIHSKLITLGNGKKVAQYFIEKNKTLVW